MAIIYSYPIAAPKGSDTIVGTQQSLDGLKNNSTVSFTIASVANYVESSMKAYIDAGDVESKFAITLRQPARFQVAVQPGDPVYITGYNVGQERYEVDLAQAGDPARMPAIGIAADAYGANDNGYIITHGAAEGINTNAFNVGDTIWVAQAGGLTNVKPSGANLVQNIGVVGKKSGGSGEIEAIALGRTNDVPNIPRGSMWVGDATGVANPLPIGTSGQILVSDGTDVNWQDGDYIEGSGTTNTLPIWSDGPNGVLNDSAIKQHDGNNITIGAIVGTATGANYTLSVGSGNNVSNGAARTLVVGANNTATSISQIDDLAIIGNNNTVSSSYSLTVGQNNQTNSGTSFVAGIGNSTSSNAARQFVMGRQNTVDSIDTIVLGDRNTVTETGTGFGSMMVFGHLNNVLGDRIICLGASNTATSNNQNTFIIGNGSTSTANNSYSIGLQNSISGNESYTFGKLNTSVSNASVVVGVNNELDGEKAYAFGFGNSRVGDESFAIGDNNDGAFADRTYLIGIENLVNADRNTTIIGQFSDPSVLSANNTQGRSTVAFAVGSNNSTRRTAWEFRGRTTSTGGTGAGDSMRIMAWALLYSTSYADDTAAATGGVEIGQLYRTGSTVKIRMT